MEVKGAAESLKPSSNVYKTNRGQIEHYGNFPINQRVIWLSIRQSFFFNAYAILVTAKVPMPDLFSKQKMLAVIFPFAALQTAIFTYVDVIATLNYLRRIRGYYEEATKNIDLDKITRLFTGLGDWMFQHISPFFNSHILSSRGYIYYFMTII